MAEHAEETISPGDIILPGLAAMGDHSGGHDNSSMTHYAQGYGDGGHDISHGDGGDHSLGCSDVTSPFLDGSIGA
jgi:hypothetical protein